jgi:hypothetical protein
MNNIEQYKKRFYNLMESTIGDAKPLISEQTNINCKGLIEIPNQGLDKPGALSQGYKPLSGNWVEDMKKVARHSKVYQIYTDGPTALRTLSTCAPSKTSVDIVEFGKDNQFITYLGKD